MERLWQEHRLKQLGSMVGGGGGSGNVPGQSK